MSMSLSPYLITNGNGKEAVAWYEEALNAKVLMVQSFGDMPADANHPIPDEAKDLILHAALQFGDSMMMISDTFPGNPHQIGNQVTIAVMVDDASLAKQIFEKLQQGGEVLMPLQETFWSPSYGMVKDKFGVTFHVSTENRK
ncbi:VOC family protein [Cohnella pontilimi]|uniref:VOC family protein n=1 Tax=Cohnella pontilimi TaxID=2564100 RepID=A0A4U0FGK4_9BACL|nr:VOC family protein [Cohnella pontilimi]TJY44051.1 VOC family protein [Cohnella pontilimi]